MALSEPKLAYLGSHFRVKLELTKSVCQKSEEFPEDLFERARSKLQSVLDSNAIERFEVFDERAKSIWQSLRDAEDILPDHVIGFTLAVGVPKLEGLSIKRPQESGAVAEISITAPKVEVRKWSFHWLLSEIRKMGLDEGKILNPNIGQIQAALLRAGAGDVIKDLEIGPRPPEPTPDEKRSKPFAIVVNRTRKEMFLVVNDVRGMLTKLTAKSTTALVKNAAKKLEGSTGVTYKVLAEGIASRFQKLQHGPESMGFDMPFMLLCGFEPPVTVETGDGMFEVNISEDKMIARISHFDLGLYDNPNLVINRDWLAKEFLKRDIPKEMFGPFIDSIAKSANDREDLTGAVVAKGQHAVAGGSPQIYETYKDNVPQDVDMDSNVIDIRGTHQQHDVCTEGSLVAEIRYLEPAQQGIDVHGKTIDPPTADDIEYTVGDGIEEKELGKFYATSDGIPVIEGQSISLHKVLNHVGDVNLRTGDIAFDGPVNIHGSVDSGATIEATGDVMITGNVRGATIKAGGDLKVAGGIFTGKGRIEAVGNVFAQFVENSTIHCEGTLSVEKAIIQSNVIVGGDIIATGSRDAVVAGGYITCKCDLKTVNIGFKRGAATKIKVGVDWKVEKTVSIKSMRLEKVEEVQKRDRAEMREIAGLRGNQLTRELVARKEELLERVRKARQICDTLKAQLEEYNKNLTYNQDSMLFAEGTVYENVELAVGGAEVPIHRELAGIAVTAKRRRGGHILPIADGKRMKKEEKKTEATASWSFGA